MKKDRSLGLDYQLHFFFCESLFAIEGGRGFLSATAAGARRRGVVVASRGRRGACRVPSSPHILPPVDSFSPLKIQYLNCLN